ncbi:MAG: PAS domain-containing protein, partial [Flavisolibacter sp.]|nr:PAS domain-containing protein [Flavisolibacter sp.]
GDIGRPIDHISTNIRNVNLISNINAVIKSGNLVEKEVYLNNSTISFMRILPYVRQDQSIDGVVITFIDITKAKELDNIIKAVFNSSVSAIMAFKVVKDERKNIIDFRWIAANHESDRFLNMSQADYIGKSLKERFPQLVQHDIFEKAVEAIVTGKPIHTEVQINNDDSFQWYDLVATQMNDGLVMTLTNIDERKQIEKKLKENLDDLFIAKENYHKLNLELEEKISARTAELQKIVQEFEFVTDFMPQMVWATGPNGYHDFYNKGWYNYTGLSFEETKGKGWNDVVHPDDQQRAWKVWKHSLETGEPYEIEYRLKRFDGEYRWFLGRALPLRNENKEIVKWFGTCTDIHDQKLANEILEQKIRERTNDLQKANAELEASNTELLQFASVASHDLKEPLRKIHIFSNLIKDRYLGNMDGAAEYLDRVITASARMTKLINDLLTFTRLSINSTFENVSLNRLVDEVMSDLELVISEKHAIIEVEDLPKVDTITGQIRQVFQNIISNALKFSRKDERPRIKITCEIVDRCAIDANRDEHGEFCRITIKDNGIGFDDQYAEKIFTIFQRLHTKEQYDGTGIGLAITRKIIEKHKGIIAATGKDGEGAKFIIVLPLKQEVGIEIEMSKN